MPVYTYRCNQCDLVFEKRHSFKETLSEKEGCQDSCELERVPSLFFVPSEVHADKAPGHHVKKVIEQTREDIKQAGRSREDYK